MQNKFLLHTNCNKNLQTQKEDLTVIEPFDILVFLFMTLNVLNGIKVSFSKNFSNKTLIVEFFRVVIKLFIQVVVFYNSSHLKV